MKPFTQRIAEPDFESSVWHLRPGEVLVWVFRSKAPDEPLCASVSTGNAPRKSQERPGKWEQAGKGPGRGAMRCMGQCPAEAGLPRGSAPQGAPGSVSITPPSVPLKNKGAGTCALCTHLFQVKGFPEDLAS